MANDPKDGSFGAKLFSPGQPDHSWNLDRLGEYARAKQEAILQGERALAPLSWSLGMTLGIARRQLGRGAWGRQLEEWNISKAMAFRARAIFRTFSSREALAGLTVEEAFGQRKRRQVHARRAKRKKNASDQSAEEPKDQLDQETESDDVGNFLSEVSTRADRLIDVAAFMKQEDRTSLIAAYRAALDRLQFLGRMLGADNEQHAGNDPVTAPARD